MKILIIDDDPAMTEIIQMVLDQYHASVYCANNGSSGLTLFDETEPDIVLLDMLMPDMDGWEVAAEIRKRSNVPILILSVIDDPKMVARALDEGADDFLIKPVPSSTLIAHINNLTRRLKTRISEPSSLNIRLQSV